MRSWRSLALAAAIACSTATAGQAASFTWAGPADVPTLDPHGTAVTTAVTIYTQIYEPLVRHIAGEAPKPALATKWEAVDKLHWRFTIRQNVKFHDGTPLTADDVVFSLDRVRGEGSDLRDYLDKVTAVNKIDDQTVEVVTSEPVPILPNRMSLFPIMSKAWSLAHNLAKPARAMTQGEQNYANFNANGTGPYKLVSRRLDDRTELAANPDYWGEKPGPTQLVFRPIKDASTRVAALISREVNLIDPVPVQDIERLKANPDLVVSTTPEWRNIYLGLNVGTDTLNGGGPGEKNPFKDVRVRRALFQAIDIEAIRSRIMRGLSKPSASPIGAGVTGYDQSVDQRPKFDPDAAKKLIAEAGYADGFKVDLDCPNDRYVSDEQICLAVVSMLARVGVKVNLIAQPSSLFFQKVFQKKSSFYMFGFGIVNGDANLLLAGVFQTGARFNFGGYSNPKIDELIGKITVEFDQKARTGMIHDVLKIVLDEVPIIPLHQQMVVWAHRKNVEVVQTPNNIMPIDLFRIK